MSTIHERITERLKEAMKSRDQAALNVLRALKSALKYAAIEKLGADGELGEGDAAAVVRKEIKKRQDSFEQFEKAGRTDLSATEKAEIAALETFLPADGAFYLYANVSRFSNDSFDFAQRMLEEAHVAATPGIDFDPVNGSHFIRFCYSGAQDEMRQAVARIGTWLRSQAR